MESHNDEKQVIEDDLKTNPDKWTPVSNEYLKCFGSNEIELDETEWNKMDYAIGRDEDYYKARFPKFSDEIISILAQCDGTNRRPDDKPNEWEKRRALEKEINERLIINFD